MYWFRNGTHRTGCENLSQLLGDWREEGILTLEEGRIGTHWETARVVDAETLEMWQQDLRGEL